MTNQQGAPEALRLADFLESLPYVDNAAAELRRLHADNKRLAALVEAQQPAQSAAAAQGQHYGPLRDADADWGKKLTVYSPTPQADSQPAMAQRAPILAYPPLPQGWTARFRCDSCDGNGEVGEPISMGHFQPPERERCPDCDGRGWCSEEDAFSADHMRAYVDADRAARAPAESGLPFGVIDPDYARAFTKARVTAWQHGYAIALQGSFTRDLDLVAIPWTDEACDAERLIAAIEYRTGLKRQGPPSDKPHGRKAVSLLFPGFEDPRWVDLSILQRAPADSVTAPAGGARPGWKTVPVEPTEAMFTRFSQQIEEGVVYVGGFLQAYRCMLDAAPTPPAQAADSVLEDAARWQWVAAHWKTVSFRFDKRSGLLAGFTLTVDATKTGDGATAIEREIDAARKQGGAT